MTNLLTWSFWFNLRPETISPFTQNCFIGLIISLILLAIIMIMAKRRGGVYRGFFKRLYTFCLSNAIIGLIFLFFNYEMVPFFSARFWLATWALIMIIWLFFIARKLKTIPLQKKQKERAEELKKYLP